MKVFFVLVPVALIAFLVFQARSYLSLDKPLPTSYQATDSENPDENTTPAESVTYTIQEFVTNLEVPWSMVFTSDTRLLVTERKGTIRVVENGTLQSQPIHTIARVHSTSEEGLMGLTKDPEYETNKYLYVCYAYEQGDKLQDIVVRFTDEGTTLTQEKTIIDAIPAASNHAGCRLKFGPDGKLYITTGDATNKNSAQDKNSLAGKILRLNNDGSIPSDNPFPNSPIWSFGHRNPQGITWHPMTEALIETEHGPSGNDGPGGGDEINQIEKAGNYGWPLVSHEKTKDGTVSPLITYTPAVAPASALIYTGSALPQFQNMLFFGALRGEGLYMVRLSPESPHKVLSYEKMKDITVGRVRDVIEGPDGAIYFSTSNQDGRGKPRPSDDKIYRIAPTQ